jgi:hypothetical protein
MKPMPRHLIEVKETKELADALCVLIADIADASDDLMDALWDFMDPGDRDLWYRAATKGRAMNRSVIKARRAALGEDINGH